MLVTGERPSPRSRISSPGPRDPGPRDPAPRDPAPRDPAPGSPAAEAGGGAPSLTPRLRRRLEPPGPPQPSGAPSGGGDQRELARGLVDHLAVQHRCSAPLDRGVVLVGLDHELGP